MKREILTALSFFVSAVFIYFLLSICTVIDAGPN
jgi:hypothetical protein